MNRSKISAVMTKILLVHDSGLIMFKNPELHSFPNSVEHSELLQNKAQKSSPMFYLNDTQNLHNIMGGKNCKADGKVLICVLNS